MRNVDEVLDLVFPELSRWILVVCKNTCERNRINYDDIHRNYVIITPIDTDNPERTPIILRNQIIHLSRSNAWNPRGRFVVALSNSFKNSSLKVQRIFEELWDHKIINVVVLVPSFEERSEMESVLKAYTWYPYENSDRCIEVDEVALLDTWVRGHFIKDADLFPPKTGLDLHGCPLRILTQPTIFTVLDPCFTYVNRPGVYKISYRDGWEIRLLNIITRKMNMTEEYLLPVKDFWNLTDDKGDFAGFTRELLQNRADLAVGLLVVRDDVPIEATRPYHWGQLSWYVPCGSIYPRWMSISRMFSGSLWASVMMSVLISVPVIMLLERLSEDSVYTTGSNVLSDTWAVILSVSVPEMPRKWSLRCFFMSWVFYSLAIDTVFQTYLTSFLTDPGVIPHEKNVEELARSDIKLGLSFRDGVFYEDKNDVQSRRIMSKKVECEDQTTCFIWATKYKNLSILFSDILYKFLISINRPEETNSKSLCEIEDGVVERGPVVMVLPKGSCLFDRINDILLHVVESGIFAEWVKITDYIQMVKTKAFFPYGLSDEYFKLSLEHLQSGFYLLLIGYFASFIIFVAEFLRKFVLST
ncbi:hypothetical protein L798_11575 [Zootermopsis nevadensis]|uniref:Uncharacterized protein n=1 Tax=Zootermopsis nevadensis TaxID=136037 RepID=A0A067QWS4_ZOONE|nr:hypothetical protein L798_11575 [Zootermopsis nevadensis]